MSNYDTTFFDYVNSGAIVSAERLLPVIREQLAIRSVLDVGCGQGAWLSVWGRLGIENYLGIDGDYVDREKLRIPESAFKPADLAEGFRLDRRFDLVQSLEVAEHLPESSAGRFVDSLVAHGDLILFSAAPNGQGGDHHVNEQPYDYWRSHFARHGYGVFDFIRPLVINDAKIEPWYRYNVFLYASEAKTATLPEAIQRSRVPADARLKDLSPWPYQVRKALIRVLPIPVVTKLAKINEKRVSRMRRAQPSGH